MQLPEGLPTKWDLADPVPDGVDIKRLMAEAEPVVGDVGEPETVGEREGKEQPSSARDRLLQLADEAADLFCDGEEAYADVWMATIVRPYQFARRDSGDGSDGSFGNRQVEVHPKRR